MDKYIYIIIYAVILIVGLISYKKYNQTLLLKGWLYFLVYSFLSETFAVYLIYNRKISADFLYNFWNIINTLFYILFFSIKVESLVKKRVIYGLLIVFVCYTLVNILVYENILVDFLSLNFIVGMILIVTTIMIYYAELLNSNSILTVQKSLFFWISIGVLIFNIGLIPVFVIGELIAWQGIFNYIILILNFLMAGSFITGFIVSKKEFNN
jgi:hypothetical protein